MSEVFAFALKRLQSITVELFRKKTINSIQVGDVRLDVVRNELLTEFEKVHESINILRLAPLKTATDLLQMGIRAFAFGEDSLNLFQNAEINAVTAFSTAPTFEGKLMAMKIRIMCTLFKTNYFGADESDVNMAYVQNECNEILKQLFDTTEVKSSITTMESGGFLSSIYSFTGGNARSKEVLRMISQLKCCVESYSQRAFGITNDKGDDVNLSVIYGQRSIKLTSLQQMINPRTIVTFNGYLYAIVDERVKFGYMPGIKVWDISTLSKAGFYPLPRKCLPSAPTIVAAGCLYIGCAYGIIMVWNLSAQTEEAVLTIAGHSKSIAELATCGDLLCAYSPGTIHVWDLTTNSVIGCLNVKYDIKALAMTYGRLYSGNSLGVIQVWDLTTLSADEVATVDGFDGFGGRDGFGRAMAICNNYLCYTGKGCIKVCDLATLAAVADLTLNGERFDALVESNGRLYSGIYNGGRIIVWDMSTFSVAGRLPHADLIRSLEVSGSCIYSFTGNGIVETLM